MKAYTLYSVFLAIPIEFKRQLKTTYNAVHYFAFKWPNADMYNSVYKLQSIKADL